MDLVLRFGFLSQKQNKTKQRREETRSGAGFMD
jgi:hypothetical protein